MNDIDIRATFAIIFASVLCIGMGYLIKKFDLAELVSGYNKNKHEKHKTLISKCVGSLLLYNGLLALVMYFGNLWLNIVSMSLVVSLYFGMLIVSIVVSIIVVNVKIKWAEKGKE